MMRMWHRQPDWELAGRGGDGKSDFVALGAARGRDRRYYSQMQRRVNAPRLACATSIVVSLLVVCRLAGAQSAAQDQPQTLPSVIPIFPLEEAMLFPNASRPLHIFEPRYRAMINDALKGDRIIGMVALRPGYEANYEGRPAIYAVGCAGVISEVEELPDGRFNIVLRGFVKFRINSEDDSRPYRLARVAAMPESLDDKEKDALHKERLRLEELVTKPGAASNVPPDISDEEVVNVLAQYVPVDPIQRQALLELDGVLLRSRALIDLLGIAGRPR
jgi:uncharacterized protein